MMATTECSRCVPEGIVCSCFTYMFNRSWSIVLLQYNIDFLLGRNYPERKCGTIIIFLVFIFPAFLLTFIYIILKIIAHVHTYKFSSTIHSIKISNLVHAH